MKKIGKSIAEVREVPCDQRTRKREYVMDKQLWSDEKILQALTQFADENGQIVFSEAAWPVLRQVRDEMQERINQLEREAEALAQGYREILAELERREETDAPRHEESPRQ